MAKFGQNLTALQERRGVNVTTLAERIGVSPSVVSGWRKDRRGLPETPTLFKLAKALNVSIEELLGGVDEEYTRLRNDRVLGLLKSIGREQELVRKLTEAHNHGVIPLVGPNQMRGLGFAHVLATVSQSLGKGVQSVEDFGRFLGGLPLADIVVFEEILKALLDSLENAAVQIPSDFAPAPSGPDVVIEDADGSDYKDAAITIVAEVEASSDGLLAWDESDDQVAEEKLSRPPDVRGLALGVRVHTDSMAPMFPAGTCLIITPNELVGDGKPAVIELVGGSRLLKILHRSEDGYLLESVNRSCPPRMVPFEKVSRTYQVRYARY